MGFSEGLSDTGELTGRGNPIVRGFDHRCRDVPRGILHSLPFLIPHYNVALFSAIVRRRVRAPAPRLLPLAFLPGHLHPSARNRDVRRHRDCRYQRRPWQYARVAGRLDRLGEPPGSPADSALRARNVVDELEVSHLGRVSLARAELDDPGVAAGPVRKARTDLAEELVDDSPASAGTSAPAAGPARRRDGPA
jgi:hypothetical protein